jgi:hypothetical protein
MNVTDLSETASSRPPRFDLYGPAHKTIRARMAHMLLELGSSNLADDRVAERAVSDLEDLLRSCERHIEHEARFIHPAITRRLPNALSKIDEGHDQHERFTTELRALMSGLRSSSTVERRRLAGRTLYLHFTAWVADTLVHMVEEESVLQALIHRFFTDGELAEVQEALVQSISPEEMFASLTHMLPALNGPERATLLAAVHAGAPPELLAALVDALAPGNGRAEDARARRRLTEAEWSELRTLCSFLA